MPHFLSSMAEQGQQIVKTSARSRKSMSARKGSPQQLRGTTSLQSSSPGRSTPSGSELNRRDVWPQTLNYSWPANTEVDLQFVGSYRCSAELQDSVLSQSPPKTGTVRPSTAGSHQAPAPASLPRPPSSWTAADDEEITVVCSDIADENVGSILSTQLKMLLKVQG